jgi:hypothetical protein
MHDAGCSSDPGGRLGCAARGPGGRAADSRRGQKLVSVHSTPEGCSGAATGDCELGRVSARHKPRQVTNSLIGRFPVRMRLKTWLSRGWFVGVLKAFVRPRSRPAAQPSDDDRA